MRVLACALFVAFVACGSSTPGPAVPLATTAPLSSSSSSSVPVVSTAPCGGQALRVRFYDVAQALSALVELPDGRRILVDTADLPTRSGCGPICQTAHDHLAHELSGKSIDMLWITHQHSDHIGGAVGLLDKVALKEFVDNGRDHGEGQIKKTHDALVAKGVHASVIDPSHPQLPIPNAGDVKLAAIVPSKWPSDCSKNKNDCSILLRIDYCSSSILFTGDAEAEEEGLVDPKPITLLQVGHHGSDTSSTSAFLQKTKPQYAVISAGKKGDGMNKGYCHPRQSTVKAVTQILGGAGSKTILSFDAKTHCDKSTDANWVDEPASDRLWATERDGDVTLVTTGDGKFSREP